MKCIARARTLRAREAARASLHWLMRVDARPVAVCAWVLLAIMATACPAHAVEDYTLPPPDPAALSPAARRMVAELTRIVADRDLAALERHTGSAARKSGDSEGRLLREVWRTAAPDTPLWEELEDMLRLGGVEQVDAAAGERIWCAPYTTCLPYGPAERPYDASEPFETVVVTGTRVALRAAPRADAPLLARVDHAVLRTARNTEYDCWEGAWRCVTWRGRPAYVSATWVRAVAGPDLQIRLLHNGDWRIEGYGGGC